METVDYKGQSYWRTAGERERPNKAGDRVTRVFRWRTKCLQCGRPFSFWNKGEDRPHYPSRRCKVHAKQGADRITEEKRMAAKRARQADWIQHNHRGRRYWRGHSITELGHEWRTRCECGAGIFSFYNPGERKIEPRPTNLFG